MTMPNRPLWTFLGVGLAASLLMSQSWLMTAHAGPLGSKDKKQFSLPARDFLPPVASINPRIDERTAAGPDDDADIEVVSLPAVSSPVIHTSPKVERLTGRINAGQFQAEQMQSVLEIQKTVDEANLERLWLSTVEKNPVIRFSLEKLATPVDLQTKQSSKFLTKTLSGLISGAALATTMMPGGGAYRDMSTMAVSNALQNMLHNKTQIQPGSLTATEQIQLAGLIDELKLKLIQSYQDYKNTLQTLAQSHETTIKNNNLYSKALASNNNLAIMAAGTAYYQALMNETRLRQKAKLHRLSLERLAGRDAVNELELAVVLPAMEATASLNTPPASSLEAPPALPDEPPAMPIGPEPLIGPEPTATGNKTVLPRGKTNAKAAKPAAAPADLPQPLELAPSLHLDSGVMPDPLPVQPKAAPAAKSAKPAAASSMARLEPASLPDILEFKEDLHQ